MSTFKFRPIEHFARKPGYSTVSHTECLGTIRQVTQTEPFTAEHLLHILSLIF